ncbi:SseB family protein [Aeromicrobium chenweiae]|uniref:SseB protein N-terminal domain-containing protein n=1 Tax=Aeromicrobium chenweiae TaxID=2079793 RepID=A0A2S0WQN5_9ACTN|nr:SseB family protein [Aeromicrobium chenweiae]AWB93600.1 hypothetical protein C3E78_16055 [Aeromicrobium chenweiae]TGN33250.1 SseB family protein [Aeromicrobium chenweiae]
MTTPDPHQPVVDLRAALLRQDAAAASDLLRRVPLAVAVAEGQARVGLADGRRVLPVFLSLESWKAFGSTDEVRPLPAADFAEVVRLLAVDSILFDPALPTAIEIPVDDVVAMLRGVVPGTEGESRILGDLHAQADVALRDRVAEQISDSLPSKLLGRIWAFSRLAPAGSVPVVALAAGIDDADLQRVAAALRASDLPQELEALILDEKQTRLADENWHDLRIQPSP